MAETAGSVQFGLTLRPLDRALQPSTEEALEWVEEERDSRGKQMEAREDMCGAKRKRSDQCKLEKRSDGSVVVSEEQ